MLVDSIRRVISEWVRPELLQSYWGIVVTDRGDGTFDVQTTAGTFLAIKCLTPWPVVTTSASVGAEVLIGWPEPLSRRQRPPVILGWVSGTPVKVKFGNGGHGIAGVGNDVTTEVTSDKIYELAASLLLTGLFAAIPSPPPPVPVPPVNLEGVIVTGSPVLEI